MRWEAYLEGLRKGKDALMMIQGLLTKEPERKWMREIREQVEELMCQIDDVTGDIPF